MSHFVVPLETILLLAEGGLTTEAIITAAITGAGGVGGTIGWLKWRQNFLEKKDEQQDEEQKNLSKALNALTTQVMDQGSSTRDEIRGSEKRTDEKLSSLSRTISRKIEGIKEVQAEHGTKLALLENETKHINNRVDNHAKKIAQIQEGD